MTAQGVPSHLQGGVHVRRSFDQARIRLLLGVDVIAIAEPDRRDHMLAHAIGAGHEHLQVKLHVIGLGVPRAGRVLAHLKHPSVFGPAKLVVGGGWFVMTVSRRG